MSLSPELRTRIETTLASNRVVLFMKGDPSSPRCGFSAKAVGILDALSPGYASVDVLADPEIREGIKDYGQWPTIPQLYIDGELIGGSDIIEQMLNSGELHEVLGVAAPRRVAAAPDTPIMAEAGFPGMTTGSWQGVYVPAGTPRPVVSKLFTVVTRVMQDPDIVRRLNDSGAEVITSRSSEDFAAFMAAQTAHWEKLVKQVGVVSD